MSRASRAWSAAGLSGTAALLAAAGGASWYYASRLTEPPGAVAPAPRQDDRLHIVTSTPTAIVVEGPGADRPGVWGLAWADGYGQIGEVLDHEGEFVARRFQLQTGSRPESAPAVIDANAYPPDPRLLGLPYAEVTIETPVGGCPAWFWPNLEGERSRRGTWVIFVHGRSARRHECFRMLPTVHAAGFPALAISYRNDADAPQSRDHRSHLGATEWEDVEAAIRFALDNGAADVILVGFSMGGACVVNTTRLSELADRVRALILEAPVLDWGPVVRAAAVERGLPRSVLPVLLPTTMRIASARTGIDWTTLRHDPASFRHPKLLIHGDADPTVPVELADVLAEARPDIVTYLRVAGAGHVRSWNVDPDAYEAAVRAFLSGV